MKVLRILGVVVALVASCLVFTASPAAAAQTLHVPGDYPTIQAAVDAAEPGDTIVVAPGTYNEEVHVEKDRLKLEGSGSREDGTILQGSFDFCGICIGREDDVVVKGVEISGFRPTGYIFGIFAQGTKNLDIDNVVTIDNAAYGIARFASEGGKIVNSAGINGGEAGIYVGDSPKAHVKLENNFVSGSQFGFFLRDASHGVVKNNEATGNCIGILLADFGSDEARRWHIRGNNVHENNELCEIEEDVFIGGIGIALLSAKESKIDKNQIWGNSNSESVLTSGGVVALSEDQAGGPLFKVKVHNNTLFDNGPPDIFWDGTGEEMSFKHNTCNNGSAIPPDLCSAAA